MIGSLAALLVVMMKIDSRPKRTPSVARDVSASPATVTRHVPTVGFFPNTFPRDPVDINLYLEHILVGQILEPLVESAPDGDISPSVAQQWTISADARTVTFIIREGITFSNGKPVMAEDVKYSLERHLTSHSQARTFLEHITTITASDPRTLRLHLDRPYVAIFKALSRDQLGIVPAGWRFDSHSDEPLIGTGPYRAVRNENGWRLLLNPYYRDRSRVRIPEWDPIFFDAKKQQYDHLPLPDLMPFLEPEVAKSVEATAGPVLTNYTRQRVNHFVQLSAWWNPAGPRASDRKLQMRAMVAMRTLIEARRAKLGFRAATGVVPEGISGYLPEIRRPSNVHAADDGETMVRLTVLVNKKNIQLMNDPTDLATIERDYGVRFNFSEYGVATADQLTDVQPDIILYSFAGGFHDPEGFLVVLTSRLNADLQSVFGADYPKYVAASSETDWNQRARLYQDLGAALIDNYVMVPGWKFDVISLTVPELAHVASVSYTPKLKNYFFATQDNEGR